NDVLTSVAARLLYGPRYRCFDDTIASRRLSWRPRGEVDPLVEACLDPDYPLVVVILDGIRAAQANPVEADLVAQLVTALRDGLRDAEGRPYRDDAAFFRHGVFIVSPHHAQIRAIQKELAARRAWRATKSRHGCCGRGTCSPSASEAPGFATSHFTKGLFTSSAVNARRHVGPVSRRIFSAMRRFVGASTAKWLAPGTSKNCTFGF